MNHELRSILNDQNPDALSAREVALVLNNAGNLRSEALAVINSAKYADTSERRDALRVLFESRAEAPAETAAVSHEDDDASALRAQRDREDEVRSAVRRTPGAFPVASATLRLHADDGDEWRGLLPSTEEYRTTLTTGVPADGGVSVATGVAGRYVDALTARSVLLRGLPAASVFPFDENRWQVPTLISSTEAGVIAEGALITEGSMTFGSLDFDPVKYSALRYASTELLQDSHLRMREVIAADMVRTISTAIDQDAFSGSGTASLLGIIGQGVSTAVGPVSYDDLTDAVARIEAQSGSASVIWCSPDVAALLRKEKASGSGDYLSGAPTLSPASTAWGLPVLSSANLPAGTAVVADGARVFVGIRTDVSVAVSDQVRFDRDQVAFRATLRVAGAAVAEAASVQVLTAV